MPIFDSIVKPALDSVTAVIGEFHMSPEDKAKADLAIRQVAQQAADTAASYDTKLNDIAGQNIRADATNGDKFTERARPSFLYVIILVLAANYIVIPCAHIFGSKAEPVTLPADLLTLFGVAICGYGFSRTAEKIAALPGQSEINVLGVKIGNKQ